MRITGRYNMSGNTEGEKMRKNTLRFLKEFDKFTDIVENQLPEDLIREDDVKYTLDAIVNEIQSQFSRYNIFVPQLLKYNLSYNPRHRITVAYVDVCADSDTENANFKLVPGISYRKMIFSKHLDIHFTISTHPLFL